MCSENRKKNTQQNCWFFSFFLFIREHTQEIETTYNKRIVIIDFDVIVYLCTVCVFHFFLFFLVFFFHAVCLLSLVWLVSMCLIYDACTIFEWKMITVSGTMHIGRGCLGLEWKRYVSKSNERNTHCSRSGVHPNMLRHDYIHHRVHRLCWCTTWEYLSSVHGTKTKFSLAESSTSIWNNLSNANEFATFSFSPSSFAVLCIFGGNFTAWNVCRNDCVRFTWQRMGKFDSLLIDSPNLDVWNHEYAFFRLS